MRYSRDKPRPHAEFLLAANSVAGRHTIDLHAQLRNTGRILDASKIELGGTDILEVEVNIQEAIPAPQLEGWKLRYQIWPRDIAIRRNMASSGWQDLEALVAGRDADKFDAQGTGIPANEFLGMLSELPEPNTGAMRWAVVIGDDSGLHLQLQALPASAPTLQGKPLLRK